MEKPAVITITDDNDEVVYMQFIDKKNIKSYQERLDKMAEDYIEITNKDTGETFYSMPDFVKHLLRTGAKENKD